MIGQISTAIAGEKLNIANMISKNKGDFAYSVLDVDGDASAVKSAIEAIDGVVRVRII